MYDLTYLHVTHVELEVILNSGILHFKLLNTLRTGDADLRLYITTVQDG